MIVPTRVRRPVLRHAFEEALDVALEGEGLEPGDEIADEASEAMRPQAFGLGDLSTAQPASVGAASVAKAYSTEEGPEASRYAASPAEAKWFIEEQLVRKPGLSELNRLRRVFAAQNHPDRVPLALRDAAAQAMAEINAKIDAAIADLKGKGS